MSALKEHITAPLMNIVKILSEDFDVGHYQVPDHVTEQEKQILNDVANLTGMGINTQSILRKPDAKFLMDFVFCRVHARVVLHAAMREAVWKNYYQGIKMMEGLVSITVL